MGPRSAGAQPGPACYGSGGTEATLTDAHFFLGRLPSQLAGLGRPLETGPAEAVIASLGKEAGLTPLATALGLLEVAEAHVVRALRTVSVERGIDPARLPLVAFGGAGPLHAASLARLLGSPSALVPARAGVLSALGLLLAPPRRDATVTVFGPLETPGTLEEAARKVVALASAAGEAVTLVAECRYRGQSHDLAVSVPSPDTTGAVVRMAFDEEHRRRNGFARPDAEVELVTVRARVDGCPALTLDDLPSWLEGKTNPDDVVVSRRSVHWDGAAVLDTPIYRREHLGAGTRLVGPAVVEDDDTTTAVPPGTECEVDAQGSLVLRWL